jgi:hypothetical protein
MSGKRLWLNGALVAFLGASGCGPWCERWCEKHHPVPAVPVGYGASPCCPCPPAPVCCPPGTVANAPPTWQRQVPVVNGCCP